jgi:hypothetical protein
VVFVIAPTARKEGTVKSEMDVAAVSPALALQTVNFVVSTDEPGTRYVGTVQSSANIEEGIVVGFWRCEREDAFTRKVRDIYRANVVRAPRTGITPLDVLAVARNRRVEPRGRLGAVLEGEPPNLPRPTSAEAADLHGQQSTALDLSVGADLTATFLAALGIPVPGATVVTTLWDGARRISFEVRGVTESRVDIGELGSVLSACRIARNPATDVFFTEPKAQMLVITRTLSSAHFAVHATGRKGQSAKVAVDGIAGLFGEAHADVEWEAEGDSTIVFRGRRPATFAFGAVPCAIRTDSTLVFGLEVTDRTFGVGADVIPEERPAIDDVGLLTFDAN